MDRPPLTPEETALNADPTAQLRLLDLQRLDAQADQARHRRRTLPQLADIVRVQGERTAVDDQARDARVHVADLTADQVKVDADVEAVKARRTRDRQRMDQGLITNPKDLERMTHELESLERRISSLEDDELEVMERLEAFQTELTRLEAEVAAADAQLAELGAARDAAFAEIDAELAELAAQRGPVAADIPADLLALYDKLRESKGGVGAAALHQRRCTGCQLTLDAAVIGEIRSTPADRVVRCEECSRILVRTAESGL